MFGSYYLLKPTDLLPGTDINHYVIHNYAKQSRNEQRTTSNEQRATNNENSHPAQRWAGFHSFAFLTLIFAFSN